eukprot:5244831-Karenia_brevis.AAC.1
MDYDGDNVIDDKDDDCDDDIDDDDADDDGNDLQCGHREEGVALGEVLDVISFSAAISAHGMSSR